MKIITEVRSEALSIEEHKKIARAMDAAKKRQQRAYLEKAHYQRLRAMTPWERSKASIERLAKDMLRLAQISGRDLTWERALKFMEGVALRGDRKRNDR